MALDTITGTLNPYTIPSEILERIGTIEGDITTIEGDISEIQSDINTIEDYINNSNHMVLIGDSWTDIDSATVIDNTNWTTYYSGWNKGVIMHNYAKGGAGFLTGTTFETQLATASSDNTYNHDLVKTVLLIGNVNDFGNSTDLSDYTTPIQNCISTIKTNFKNARVVFFLASCDRPDAYQIPSSRTWMNMNYFNHSLRRYISTINSNISYECYILAPFFTLSSFITYGEDNYARHLSKNGHYLLARGIDYCLTHRKEPIGIATIYDDYTTGNFTINHLQCEYNTDNIIIDVLFTVDTELTSTGNIYVPLLDSAFYQSDVALQFSGVFTDVLPPMTSATAEISCAFMKYATSKLFKVEPARLNIANSRSDFYCFLAYGFSAGRHGLFFRCPTASTTAVATGQYYVRLEYKNWKSVVNDNLIYQGNIN